MKKSINAAVLMTLLSLSISAFAGNGQIGSADEGRFLSNKLKSFQDVRCQVNDRSVDLTQKSFSDGVEGKVVDKSGFLFVGNVERDGVTTYFRIASVGQYPSYHVNEPGPDMNKDKFWPGVTIVTYQKGLFDPMKNFTRATGGLDTGVEFFTLGKGAIHINCEARYGLGQRK
ncbi:hypothetical protein AZI86_16325 [Bdellovibrio bacteriovorus]|uniref:Uncharacterized protein n=1 Tax=Bdellovibrio bacteriovorus TaxID=959 RepID=A0A150WH32_BDEBC|nr:hypothetical protein [Bdellovibrio bacteriovorus]KYG62401.1 hypothetical protein AZI86_16325 [Bdellovibrio bacteriovorus]